jgi:hypothetical protein
VDFLGKDSNSKLSDRISNLSAARQANAPTYIEVGINFGEYFPSSCKQEKQEVEHESASQKLNYSFEQVCDEPDYSTYFS